MKTTTYNIKKKDKQFQQWLEFCVELSKKDGLRELAFYRRTFPNDEYRLVKIEITTKETIIK